MEDQIQRAKELIADAASITVITGAGISTDSGIPDFRGPNGIWTKDPDAEKVTDIKHYKLDPKVRAKTWGGYVEVDWNQYEPNAGHLAIKELYDKEKLLLCITQNIDGLHIKSGLPPERVTELHGNLREIICLGCSKLSPAEPTASPTCTSCGGLNKPNVVMFGENLDPIAYHRSETASIMCDLLLVVGTSLMVWPVADLPQAAMHSGIPVIYINRDPAPQHVTLSLLGSISEILPQIV